jgi:hypothetical protein
MTHRPKPPAPPTIGADAAARTRPWLVDLATYTGLAVWTLTAVTTVGIAAAIAWHLVRWAWRTPEQPIVLALVALVSAGLYRWERLAAGFADEADA